MMKTRHIATLFIILLAVLVLPAQSALAERCQAITQKGTQCKREAEPGSIYCWQHKRIYEGKYQEENALNIASQWVVHGVIDGDTIWAGGQKIRYIGINAPETHRKDRLTQELGARAKAFNAGLVMGKTIRLEFDVQQVDKYGRLLAYVFTDGVFVNAEMVRTGYASASTVPPNLRHADLFRRLERESKKAKRGLWACE